jgi:hypothetical protein
MVGASRSAVHDLCASVLSIPRSQGAIQKRVDRVSEASVPHDTALGEVARTSLGNSIDETSWLMHGNRHWLWVMANAAVAYCQMHTCRSKAALAQLIGGWQGILVSDGYGVSQSWEGLRQSSLAHLIRTAKGLAESVGHALPSEPLLGFCERPLRCSQPVNRERHAGAPPSHFPTVQYSWYALHTTCRTRSPGE